MYTGEEFSEATDDVAEFLDAISDGDIAQYELTEDSNEPSEADEESADDEEPEENRRRIIHVEEPVGPDYAVVANEGERMFRLQSHYHLWRDVADHISIELAEDLSPEDAAEDHPAHQYVPNLNGLEEDESVRLVGAFELLRSLSTEERRELIFQLTDVFTDAGLKHSIDAVAPEVGIAGFHVHHKIFPYENAFGIAHMNEVVERVRMAAHMGELLLKYAVSLPIDMSGTTEGEVTGAVDTPAPITDLDDAIESPFENY